MHNPIRKCGAPILVPVSPLHGEFQRTKTRISKKDVLAVAYYSMSFEMVDTGGEKYAYLRLF